MSPGDQGYITQNMLKFIKLALCAILSVKELVFIWFSHFVVGLVWLAYMEMC